MPRLAKNPISRYHSYTMAAVNVITVETPANEKYRFKPFVGSSHWWAMQKLAGLPTTPTSVLDIGPGSGVMGEILRQQGVTRLDAIEIDPTARKNAEKIYTTVVGSFDELPSAKYDLVLMLDVLEHTPNPQEFYSRALTSLNPGGIALISVPNVAHWSVRIPLLFGYFEYKPRGIMDQTHLSLFTRKSFTRLLKSFNGAKISELSSSIEPAEFVLPKAIWDNGLFTACSHFRIAVANVLPGLFAYQHLALVKV